MVSQSRSTAEINREPSDLECTYFSLRDGSKVETQRCWSLNHEQLTIDRAVYERCAHASYPLTYTRPANSGGYGYAPAARGRAEVIENRSTRGSV